MDCKNTRFSGETPGGASLIMRCSLTELRKTSEARYKFHQRGLLTTNDVTEKTFFNIHVFQKR